VPQECLILTMKANQKYFPLLDAQNKLTNQFLVVSNIAPTDASKVIGGNERVVRPRLADAKFFFDQDRKKKLADRLPQLAKVVYHNKLGSQGERNERVQEIALSIAKLIKPADAPFAADVKLATQLSKADLVTDMVGEFPELQGIMGRYYALNDGLSTNIADAIEDHYKPRFAGDSLPRNPVGMVAALADKLETLAGLFSIGQVPTGDKDPFGLRRHALGVIRMLVDGKLPLALDSLLDAACAPFSIDTEKRTALESFIYDRAAGFGKDQGASTLEVDAVLAKRPQRFDQLPALLAAATAFAGLAEAPALAAANKRIQNILKKTGETIAPKFDAATLVEPQEKVLADKLAALTPSVTADYASGQFTQALQSLAALKEPVDAFFDHVMVNAEDVNLRNNRLGLLSSLNQLMNGAIDISKLAQ
jgi:glycyl-tRNA synthetase beta chain